MTTWVSRIPAVWIDGTLYVLIAVQVFCLTYLSSDEAAKWIEPETKFWTIFAIALAGVVFGSIKTFRSTSLSDHRAKTNGVHPAP